MDHDPTTQQPEQFVQPEQPDTPPPQPLKPRRRIFNPYTTKPRTDRSEEGETDRHDEEAHLMLLQLQFKRQQRMLERYAEHGEALDKERLDPRPSDPLPHEIRQACAAIRENWTREEHLARFYFGIKVRSERRVIQQMDPHDMDYLLEGNGSNQEDCPLYGTPYYQRAEMLEGLPHPLGWTDEERMYHALHLNRSA